MRYELSGQEWREAVRRQSLLHNRGWRRWRRVCDERAALGELSFLHGVEFAVQLVSSASRSASVFEESSGDLRSALSATRRVLSLLRAAQSIS